MKIASIETIPLAIPFQHGGGTAFRGQDWSKIHVLLLRIETSDGLTGWGDAFAYNCWRSVKAAVDHMVAPIAVGRDIEDIPAFMRDLAQMLHIFGQNGVTQYALSGLDIALWDIRAKSLAQPLHRLLGTAGRTELPGYASLFKYRDADIVRDKCRQSLAEGFRAIKLHETEHREISAARLACGWDIPLMVDVNCPWTPAEALEAALRLKHLDLFWLEEPIFPPDDLKALAQLQKDGGIRLAAGENACGLLEFERMLDADAVRFAQPSVTKVGGISTFLEIQRLCDRRGVPVYPHSPYFGPGFLATLQLAAARDAEPLVEWFKLDLEADPFGRLAHPNNGCFHLPGGPGLGCDPDPDVIRDYRVAC
jgi:L-alanine-DL-glutamate epimerase-like enolase superfamily enzyme